MSKRKINYYKNRLFFLVIAAILYFIYVNYYDDIRNYFYSKFYDTYEVFDIPEYTNEPYVFINNNNPNFSLKDMHTNSFESYSKLDFLGRTGVAYANLGIDLMPTGKREEISRVKPSGWKIVKYDDIDGKYFYNRCHLIAYQLSGENANPNNLITCTRNMNAKVMTEFEQKVAKYIRKTKNHVLYRVTPIYRGTNLIASGVQMEALSVEDNGKGIKFNVYIYNVQDGYYIDYSNGDNHPL